ncbi:MAG: 4Fe-4S dicluster domain-containing protein [Coriobacteriales bacterium]|nr:4Fe-4S dicluster domain-containing protein [Coriobacteriales bacterium]
MKKCLVINLDRCTGCDTCVVSCKFENKIPLGVYWNRVIPVGPFGDFPDLQQYWLPAQCQQCENAPCIEVCPTGASYRDENSNVVLIDKEKCIGCQTCIPACPYGVRMLNVDANIVEKCTLCNHLDETKEKPACVVTCCSGARFYGDLDDPESDASKELAKYDESCIHSLPDIGNGPTTRYILSPSIAEWQDVF